MLLGGGEAADDFDAEEARRAEGGASRLGDRSELMSMSAAERRAEMEWAGHATRRWRIMARVMDGRAGL